MGYFGVLGLVYARKHVLYSAFRKIFSGILEKDQGWRREAKQLLAVL